jgi:hypothetical protein
MPSPAIDPFLDAIATIVGNLPDPWPAELRGLTNSEQLSDYQYNALRDYCSVHANPPWATGTGVIEAADHLVLSAIENGNIQKDTTDCSKYRFVNG